MASRVLVFDMGGVLYDFRGAQLIAQTSRRARRWRSEEIRERWLPLAHGFETGVCDALDFAHAVVNDYDLALTPAELLLEFRAAAAGFYEGALGLLSELRDQHRLLSLSNTNPVQWAKVLRDLGSEDPFLAHHPSHLSGFHKPDQRAFEAVRATLEPACDCYFFDDRAQNVSAARDAGWQAWRVRGVSEARRVCAELGFIAQR